VIVDLEKFMNSKFKNHCVLVGSVILAALAIPGLAQTYTYSPGYAPAPPVSPPDMSQLTYSAEQLDQILGPVALYPDPLLSELLAAATYPQDVAAAGQWLAIRPDRSAGEIDAQPWDPSVKAVCRVPDVVEMMAGNMPWTEALGNAFVNQQPAVMDSVQRLRLVAQSAQTLKTTPQQTVINDGGVVEILPAQPDVIYCPVYDPALVYSTPAVVSFGPACAYGAFFDLGLDFHQHRLLRDVHFDRDRHRFDFAQARAWEHDPHRPVPRPREAFTAPRAADMHRGWNETTRVPGAFIPGDRGGERGRQPAPAARREERPVTGLPAAPQRRPEDARPAPAAPPRNVPGAQQRAVPPRAPAAARPSAPVPARPEVRAAPQRNERPVTGLPQRPAPVVRTPEPVAPQRAAPAERPAQVERPAPAAAQRQAAPSAFRPGGGGAAASARGNGSMHR
jgi:hypothetical protein